MMEAASPAPDERSTGNGGRGAPHALEEAERTAERYRLLARADNLLHRTLDYAETLEALAAFVVEYVADYCLIDVLRPSGEMQRVTHARDAGAESLLDEAGRFTLDPTAATPGGHVLRTGEPVFQPQVDEGFLKRAARDEVHLRVLSRLNPTSSLVVPLQAHERRVGVMTLARTGDHPFDADDLALAVELGLRGGLAIVNATLYHAARSANRAKTNFLSVISHELRTPLAAIIGYADLLEHGIDGELNEGQHSKVARIKASSNHLLQLIEEILDFANRSGEDQPLHLEDTTVARILAEVEAVASSLARDRSVELRVEAPPGEARMSTDPRKLRQILLNLVSNGIKFTEQGHVALTAEVDEHDVLFAVRDTGIGIEPDRLDDIFEPFWQVEDPMTRKVGGTGLGLSVARSFARLLGGEITVSSQPDVGSTFHVRLPRVPPSATPEVALD